MARVAEALGVVWSTANDDVLAEGQRVLISGPHRVDGVSVIGVDEHVWWHTRHGDKYVTPRRRLDADYVSQFDVISDARIVAGAAADRGTAAAGPRQIALDMSAELLAGFGWPAKVEFFAMTRQTSFAGIDTRLRGDSELGTEWAICVKELQSSRLLTA